MAAETSQTLDRGLRVLDPGRDARRADRHRAGRPARGEPHRRLPAGRHPRAARAGPPRRPRPAARRARRAALARGLQPVLRDLAVPVLRALAEELGCTAHLTVADGEEALALAVVEPSWTDFHVGYRVGARHPLDQGAAGKAILLGRTRRRAAYAETAGEIQAGAHGVAAPVLGVEGLEASVGIVSLGDFDATSSGRRWYLRPPRSRAGCRERLPPSAATSSGPRPAVLPTSSRSSSTRASSSTPTSGSRLGIELLTIDARIVIASVDTYLRFAEATNRLDLEERAGPDGADRRGGGRSSRKSRRTSPRRR